MPDLRPVLSRYPLLHDDAGRVIARRAVDLPVQPMSGGLINATYAIGEDHVLQRLHPIFGAEVNRDIAALVPQLRGAGVRVPAILNADDGQPFVRVAPDAHPDTPAGVWRLLTRLPGRTLHRLADRHQAASAARLVARFHAALAPVSHQFAFSRPGAHDTPAHMATLREALTHHPEHRLHHAVHELAAELFAAWGEHPGVATLPDRIGHGDLKVSNLLFDERGEACAVIDLDTMAWLGLDAELGDALRSWANRAEEHETRARLQVGLLEAAVASYLQHSGDWISEAEVAAIVPGMARIALELAARFAADALNERYFGWNPKLAPARGEHNLLRARNQLQLGRQVLSYLAGD